MDAIETIELDSGLTIKIYGDEDPGNPRECFDNAGKLVIYDKGGNFVGVNELGGTYFPTQDYSGWDELDKAVLEAYPRAEILPVYRYEHSCVAYNTTGFNDPWDSGRVGFILCTRETIISEWGKKIASKSAREKARRYMAAEVESYSMWANGEVYCFSVHDGDEELECASGFFGLEYCEESAREAAESLANGLKPKEERERIRQAQCEREELEAAGQQRLAFG